MTDSLERVFRILEAVEKHEAIDEIIASCSIFSSLPDRDRFARAVHRREREQSTGIGHGVAIAHGRLPHLEKPLIALGFSEHGIPFDDAYPEPVRLVFVIASSQNRDSDYLRAVSSILTWVHDPGFRHLLVGKAWEDESVITFLSMLEKQDFHPRG